MSHWEELIVLHWWPRYTSLRRHFAMLAILASTTLWCPWTSSRSRRPRAFKQSCLQTHHTPINAIQTEITSTSTSRRLKVLQSSPCTHTYNWNWFTESNAISFHLKTQDFERKKIPESNPPDHCKPRCDYHIFQEPFPRNLSRPVPIHTMLYATSCGYTCRNHKCEVNHCSCLHEILISI